MNRISEGAHRLPSHHITIRVPWHDGGWTGHVCSRPLDNTSCLILKRVAEQRRDEVEAANAGKRFDQIPSHHLPPCVSERVSFMAPFQLSRQITHPYVKTAAETHGHFKPTRFDRPAYGAACVPYRWMLREVVEEGMEGGIGLAEELQIDWVPYREPDIGFKTSWVQDRDNQLALLDTFFGALRPEESLCFIYAKRTPLSDQAKRVIVGVGRVLSVGPAIEYDYSTPNPPLRSMLWERNIGHSIRPDCADGFLFPYQEALRLAEREGVDPEEFVAFAPDEHFDAYSYGSELLSHDGAVASLMACAATLHRIRDRIEGPWDRALTWIDTQLNRLWKARGAFPGLGSALSAFGYEWGFQYGSLLAYEIELIRERQNDTDPWTLVDTVMKDPSRLDSAVRNHLSDGLRRGWERLATDKRALLHLLSRCAISEEQARRFYDSEHRRKAGITTADSDVIRNPYLLFEMDRRALRSVQFGAVDRGMFPDKAVRDKFPVPEPSRVADPADRRRVRALMVDLLEEAAREGHTLLPRSRIIHRARERDLQPPCPLGENVLAVMEDSFGHTIKRAETRGGEPAYQVDRLVDCRRTIRREIRVRHRGRRHVANHDWRHRVDSGLPGPMPSGSGDRKSEELARTEKAEALKQLFCSRVSVLIGSAGTGKTTLLKMLCDLPGIAKNGLLLLAPTGKARVRLEKQTGRQGAGRTLAQFLNRHGRYNGNTGAYFPNPKAGRCSSYRTVIVDESSMLTEEQLAALIDCLANVERLVLVGDTRQLPPIGAGRPFVDIVKALEPPDLGTDVVRCGPSYGELTIPQRQVGESRADVLLASHFGGEARDPGADAVLDPVADGHDGRLRLVQWDNPQQLQEKVIEELVLALELAGTDDELGFEESIGGSRFRDVPWAFFWPRSPNRPGAAERVEEWQILSPLRAGSVGVDALNRAIQGQFRARVRELADGPRWQRKVPRPVGPQALLYGDKVINVINQRRRDVWPKPDGGAYIANGDIGVVVGQYKGKKFRRAPEKLEVEWAGQPGHKYAFSPREFGEEASNPLELAYSLTVHKTQGSEFGLSLVVLTNPCWLLSRELLYTAMTRHKNKLVVLHQGPFADYLEYTRDEHCEIARRMTNLFSDPLPREVEIGKRSRFLEDRLIHRTERGELVRSKSELVIADKLHDRGIDYAYEQPLHLANDRIRYPDFTIADDASGVTYYWEHLGLYHDPGYRERWEQKRAEYIDAGVAPAASGGDSDRILIETKDDQGGGLDAKELARLIDEVILG